MPLIPPSLRLWSRTDWIVLCILLALLGAGFAWSVHRDARCDWLGTHYHQRDLHWDEWMDCQSRRP